MLLEERVELFVLVFGELSGLGVILGVYLLGVEVGILVWLELLMFGLAVVTYLIFTGGSASQFLSTSQRSRLKE